MEEDTCRICRTGADDDSPLYHPCKCSGSIAKVHQDCLIEWLQHSKKKSCELCNTELRFHKVYSPSMPTKLPSYLYAKRLVFQAFWTLRMTLRAIFVATAWLAILPLGNIYIWRLHFWIVDVLVWGLKGGSPPIYSRIASDAINQQQNRSNTSYSIADVRLDTSDSKQNRAFLLRILFPFIPVEKHILRMLGTTSVRRIADVLGHDIFEGQVLTCAVVILFVALFLLREWCLQNMPQQMDVLAGARDAAARVEAAVGPGGDRGDRQAIEFAQNAFPDVNAATPTEDSNQEESNDADANNDEVKGDDAEAIDDAPSVEELRLRRSKKFSQRYQDANNVNDQISQGEATLSTTHAESSNTRKDKERATNDFFNEDDEIFQIENDSDSEDAGRFVGISFEKKKESESNSLEISRDSEQPNVEQPELDPEIDQTSEVDDEDEDEDEDNADDQNAEADNDDDDDDDVNNNAAIDAHGRAGQGAVIDLADWEEDADNGERFEDDLEGMMEAIGMRGPFINLVTNMTMMFVLCSFILIVFVAVPYMIGRLVGLGDNVVKMVIIPHKLLRKLTDPIVDRIVAFLQDLVGINKHAAVKSIPKAFWRSTTSLIIVADGKTLNSRETLSIALQTVRANSVKDVQAWLSDSISFIIKLKERTNGRTNKDRAFCVGLGLFYWFIGLLVQDKFSYYYVRWNLKALKGFVDQQLVVLKVLAFILLELVVFPLGCGILTDASLYPLWKDVTFSTRIAFFLNKPLSTSFTLWSLGTLYMFALAQFVTHTRSIVRSGVLCFVRDAGDPNFHPIKDILERGSLEQLRKIGISAGIYSGILAITLGFCARAIKFFGHKYQIASLPLNWNVHQSFTSTGLELICIAVLLPIAVKAWFPSNGYRKIARKWWKVVARHLRISSYLIGGRFPDEECEESWSLWVVKFGFNTTNFSQEQNTNKTGGFARVPADDRAITATPLVIRTDVNGEPLTDRGKEAVQEQNDAILKQTKKSQYTTVYLPPHFRFRIIALIIALWATICFLMIVGFLPPLIVGRSTLARIGWQEYALHDGYAWILGYSVIGISQTLAAKANRMYQKIRTSSNAWRRFGKHVRRFIQRIWLVFCFGFITSTLLGLCIEVYLNGISRPFTGNAQMPEISLLHVWTMGLLEQHLIFEILRAVFGRNFQPNYDFVLHGLGPPMALLEIQNGGWRKPRAWLLTKKAFFPTIILGVMVLFAPSIFILVASQIIDQSKMSDQAKALQICLAHSYCLALLLAGPITRLISKRMDKWTDVIKDENYLISTQLKNYSTDSNGHLKKNESQFNAEGPIPDTLLHAARR